jgi:diacylglycerol kinase (ATP)
VLRKSELGRQLIDLTGGNRRREVVYSSGRTIDIVIDGGPEEFEIDGEERGQITAARFTIDPEALVVRVAEPPKPKQADEPVAGEPTETVEEADDAGQTEEIEPPEEIEELEQAEAAEQADK